MSKRLEAVFALSAMHLRSIITSEEEKAGGPFSVTLDSTDVSGAGRVHATGAAQDVMFVIGAVANNGYEALCYVVPA